MTAPSQRVRRALLLPLLLAGPALAFWGAPPPSPRGAAGPAPRDDGRHVPRLVAASAAAAALGARAEPTLAASWRKWSTRPLAEKIASVPVFVITNGYGSPYLMFTGDGNQQCVFFFNKDDAIDMLDEMVQSSPQLGDARVIAMGLDRAWGLAKTGKTRTRQGDDGDEQETRVNYKLSADAREAKAATKLPGGKKLRPGAVPVFYAEGVTSEVHGENIQPIFFSLEDAQAAAAGAAVAAGAEKPAAVKVVSLLDLLVSFEYGGEQEHGEFGFVASAESREFVRGARAGGSGRAKNHVRL